MSRPLRPSERKALEQQYETCAKCKAQVCPILMAESSRILCELWKTKKPYGPCPYDESIAYGQGMLILRNGEWVEAA